MNMRKTPIERLLLALLNLNPGSTEAELLAAVGSDSPKHARRTLRGMVLAGWVTVSDSDPATYNVAASAESE